MPRRDVVETVCNNIRQSVVSKSSSFDVIQGPSGEGKTTALFQVMATMKLEFPKAVILNFTHSASLLTPDILTSFEQSEEVFLFLDEVDKAIPWVQGIISQIHELNFRHIHLISAVRDIQWQFSGGATVNWNAYVKTRKHSLSQLSRPDALSLVSSWAKIGREALGELALIADVDGRVERLLSVAQSYRGGAKNSLFGAMLEIRYGDGLKEHVRELLGQLKDRTFYGRKADGSDSDSYNFAEAFLVISLMHDVGNTPISKERLGSVFGLGQAELANSVLVSLGEESPVAFEGNFVVTRHRSIAASALSLGQEMGIGVEYLVERLVRKAVEDAERPTRGFDESLRPYCYLARSLELGRLQIVAAEAAVDASPNRLSYRSTLSAVYRQNEILDLALKANVDAALLFPTAADRSTGIRVSLHEWAVTAGSAGSPYANAFLAGLALADLWPDSEMNFDQISKTLMVVGIGLENAIKEQPKYPYMAGLNAVVELFELCRPYLQGESESKVERRLKLWKDEISSFGVETNFKDLAQIFSLLLRALQEARSNCESEYVRPVQGMKLQFERLHKKIRSKLNYGHNYAYTDR
ncbi:P-loop NTPase [Glutamicibacter sp. MCAF14]|uniref:P-loop NTPase n=1 Tax=Glutamicibacter sp. MCAF14 TaxID=3233043 RepID=UPI003F933B3B